MHAENMWTAFLSEEDVIPFPRDALSRLPSLLSLFLLTPFSWYGSCHAKRCLTAVPRPGRANPPLATRHKVSFLSGRTKRRDGVGTSGNPPSQLKARDYTGRSVQTLPLFLSLAILVLFDIPRPRSFRRFSVSVLLPELLVSGSLRLSSPRCSLGAPGRPRQGRCAPARPRWSHLFLHQELSVPSAKPGFSCFTPRRGPLRGVSASKPSRTHPPGAAPERGGPGAGRSGRGSLGPAGGGAARSPLPALASCGPARHGGRVGRGAAGRRVGGGGARTHRAALGAGHFAGHLRGLYVGAGEDAGGRRVFWGKGGCTWRGDPAGLGPVRFPRAGHGSLRPGTVQGWVSPRSVCPLRSHLSPLAEASVWVTSCLASALPGCSFGLKVLGQSWRSVIISWLCRLWSALSEPSGERSKPCYLRLYHDLDEAVAARWQPCPCWGNDARFVLSEGVKVCCLRREALMLGDADSHPC